MQKLISATPTEIGWCEIISLPQLGLSQVRAKIDTGATTSCLHATDIERFSRNGQDMIAFLSREDGGDLRRHEALLADQRLVRSSNGEGELRYVIETQMELGNKAWDAHLTLTDRSAMRFPLLVGRRALREGFLVNSALQWTLGAPE